MCDSGWIRTGQGLGFQRTARKRRTRERNAQKNERNGSFPLLYKLANRVGSNPTHSHALQAVWSRFNGSGSIRRPRGVLEIRIHLWVWVWAFTRGFGLSFSFLEFSCYVHPCACNLDLLCVLISLQKFQKITLCSWSISLLFCDDCYMLKLIKNVCAFILHIRVFLCVLLMSFLHNCWPKFMPYNVNWHLILWFYPLWFHDNTFDLSKVNSLLFLCNIFTLLKLEFCDISHVLVKIDSWLQFCDVSFLTLLKVILDYNFVIFCNYV